MSAPASIAGDGTDTGGGRGSPLASPASVAAPKAPSLAQAPPQTIAASLPLLLPRAKLDVHLPRATPSSASAAEARATAAAVSLAPPPLEAPIGGALIPCRAEEMGWRRWGAGDEVSVKNMVLEVMGGGCKSGGRWIQK